MAKRISKKASSPVIQKEKPAIKGTTLAAAKKEIQKKSRLKKINIVESKEEIKKRIPAPKKAAAVKIKNERGKKTVSEKAVSAKAKKESVNPPAVGKKTSEKANKPALRSVYSNSKYTLMVLGFGSDFNTKKSVVIFSDLLTGQVHTITLALWNRWKLKEVKKINTET
jgi:hypothetical protein